MTILLILSILFNVFIFIIYLIEREDKKFANEARDRLLDTMFDKNNTICHLEKQIKRYKDELYFK